VLECPYTFGYLMHFILRNEEEERESHPTEAYARLWLLC